MGPTDLYALLVIPCFKSQTQRKAMVQFLVVYGNPFQNGRLNLGMS